MRAAGTPILRVVLPVAVFGLMVGLERERKKGDGEERGAIGLRTCAVTALAGYVAMVIGGIVVLSVLLVVTGLLLGASYLRSRDRDPGLTSEMALLLTACLGALCQQDAVVAVALATLALWVRFGLTRFASLSEGRRLLLAAARASIDAHLFGGRVANGGAVDAASTSRVERVQPTG